MNEFKTYDCFHCRFLNRERKRVSETTQHCMYGCDARKSRYVVGWIRKENELKTMGCSDSNVLVFGDVFVIMEQPYYSTMYLGKVNGKRLLYNQDINKYELVKDDYLDKKAIKLQCRFGHDRMCTERRKCYGYNRD